MSILLPHFPKIKKAFLTFLYRTLKHMFGIKSNPLEESLLTTVLDNNPDKLLNALAKTTQQRVDQEEFDPEDIELIGRHKQRLKSLIDKNLKNVVAVCCDRLVCINPKRPLQCPCSETMNDSHWKRCPEA